MGDVPRNQNDPSRREDNLGRVTVPPEDRVTVSTRRTRQLSPVSRAGPRFQERTQTSRDLRVRELCEPPGGQEVPQHTALLQLARLVAGSGGRLGGDELRHLRELQRARPLPTLERRVRSTHTRLGRGAVLTVRETSTERIRVEPCRPVTGDAVTGDAVTGDAVTGDAVVGDAEIDDAVNGGVVACDAVTGSARLRSTVDTDVLQPARHEPDGSSTYNTPRIPRNASRRDSSYRQSADSGPINGSYDPHDVSPRMLDQSAGGMTTIEATSVPSRRSSRRLGLSYLRPELWPPPPNRDVRHERIDERLFSPGEESRFAGLLVAAETEERREMMREEEGRSEKRKQELKDGLEECVGDQRQALPSSLSRSAQRTGTERHSAPHAVNSVVVFKHCGSPIGHSTCSCRKRTRVDEPAVVEELSAVAAKSIRLNILGNRCTLRAPPDANKGRSQPTAEEADAGLSIVQASSMRENRSLQDETQEVSTCEVGSIINRRFDVRKGLLLFDIDPGSSNPPISSSSSIIIVLRDISDKLNNPPGHPPLTSKVYLQSGMTATRPSGRRNPSVFLGQSRLHPSDVRGGGTGGGGDGGVGRGGYGDGESQDSLLWRLLLLRDDSLPLAPSGVTVQRVTMPPAAASDLLRRLSDYGAVPADRWLHPAVTEAPAGLGDVVLLPVPARTPEGTANDWSVPAAEEEGAATTDILLLPVPTETARSRADDWSPPATAEDRVVTTDILLLPVPTDVARSRADDWSPPAVAENRAVTTDILLLPVPAETARSRTDDRSPPAAVGVGTARTDMFLLPGPTEIAEIAGNKADDWSIPMEPEAAADTVDILLLPVPAETAGSRTDDLPLPMEPEAAAGTVDIFLLPVPAETAVSTAEGRQCPTAPGIEDTLGLPAVVTTADDWTRSAVPEVDASDRWSVTLSEHRCGYREIIIRQLPDEESDNIIITSDMSGHAIREPNTEMRGSVIVLDEAARSGTSEMLTTDRYLLPAGNGRPGSTGVIPVFLTADQSPVLVPERLSTGHHDLHRSPRPHLLGLPLLEESAAVRQDAADTAVGVRVPVTDPPGATRQSTPTSPGQPEIRPNLPIAADRLNEVVWVGRLLLTKLVVVV